MTLAVATMSLVLCVLAVPLVRVARYRWLRWVPYLAGAVALTASAALAAERVHSLPWRLAAFRVEILGVALFLAAFVEHVGHLAGSGPGRLERALAASLLAVGLISQVPGVPFVVGPAGPGGVATLEPGAVALAGAALAVGAVAASIARIAWARRRGRRLRVQLASLVVVGAGVAFEVARFLTGASSTESAGVIPVLLGVPVLLEALAFVGRISEDARRLDEAHARVVERAEERTTELVDAHDNLAAAERLGALGRIAANVAHEVNNPAMVVRSNLSYVLERLGEGETLPEDGRAALEDAALAVDRITALVHQLRLAGHAADVAPGAAGPVGVREVVDAALRHFPSLGGSFVELEVAVEPDLRVQAARDALEHALVKLLENAVRAVQDRGEDRGRIRVHAAPHGEARVALVVEDDGIGMGDTVRDQIFEPFFTTRPFGQGAGLGLAVTRGLLRSMGGELTIDSALGEGTRATLWLPRDGRDAPAPRASSEVRALAPRTRPLDHTPHVLLVEDDPLVRRAIERRLSRSFRAESVGGVHEALARLSEQPTPDLVLCDVMMRDGGGEAVYRRVAHERPSLARRMVFLTGGATDPAAQDFLRSQPQPVLEKPLDLDALRAAFARLLDRESTEPGPGEATA